MEGFLEGWCRSIVPQKVTYDIWPPSLSERLASWGINISWSPQWSCTRRVLLLKISHFSTHHMSTWEFHPMWNGAIILQCCKKLTKVDVNVGMVGIHRDTFSGCISLQSIKYYHWLSKRFIHLLKVMVVQYSWQMMTLTVACHKLDNHFYPPRMNLS